MAACAIRDDGFRAATNCIQTPDEWNESADLLQQMNLTSRLDHLKAISKSNKKKVTFNQLGGVKPSSVIIQSSPDELEYPIKRPNFNQQPTKNSLNGVLVQSWQPNQESPSYNKLSILSQQEYLPIIKGQHVASLIRGGTTTAPSIELEAEQIDLDSSTNALLTELLHLTDKQSLLTTGSDHTNLSTGSPTSGK